MGQRNNYRSTHQSRHLSDDVARFCDNITVNYDTANSLTRLRTLDVSLDVYRRFRVKTLAQKRVNVPGLQDVAKRLVQKIQRMEDEEEEERSRWRKRASSYRLDNSRSHRTRASYSGATAATSSGVSFFGAPRASSTPYAPDEEGSSGDYYRHLELLPTPEVPRVQWAVAPPPPPPAPPSEYMQKPPGLLDVSDLCNLSEDDYDRVRPTLIFLSARELKAFMDRNPKIDAIADGLFRRHCQMDCPDEMWRKPHMYDKWRTLHDVFNNWKLFEEHVDKMRTDVI